MPITSEDLNNYKRPKIDWNVDSHEWYPKMENIDYVHRLESVPLNQIEKYVKIKKSVNAGEKVVCINNIFACDVPELKLNKIYKIYEIFLMADFTIWIKIDENSSYYHPYNNHFITLKKQRKDKLKKINE